MNKKAMERLKSERIKKNKTQKDVADFLGLTKQAVQRYEAGLSTPKLATWEKLADFFDVPVGYLQGTNDIREKFYFEDYDFHQAWMQSDKAQEAFKNSTEVDYDSPEEYEYDEKMGLNDIYLNQFRLIKKMFFYGDDTDSQILDKRTKINLVKALDLVFSNALQIEDDIRNYDVEEPTSYTNQEVNKYVDLIKKYNPYWTNYSDLNIAFANDKEVFYKDTKLSSEQIKKLKELLTTFEQQNR